MSRKLRALGLTVLALCGLTALMATSAQANWLEGAGVEVMANKNVLAKAHTTGKLIVEKLNFEIRCPTLEPEGLKIVGKSTTAEGKVKFSGCKGFEKSTGTEQKNCEPLTGTEKGVIKAGGLALVVKLAKVKAGTLQTYILFEPVTGKAFTTVELPEACALTQTSEVKGSLVAECGLLNGSSVFVGEDCNITRVTHLLQPSAVLTLFNGTKDETPVEDILLFGKNTATLQGIASVELESKVTWAGDA